MYRRAMKKLGLHKHFSKNKVARTSVLVFLCFYVLRALTIIGHSVISCIELYKLNKNAITLIDVT